MRQLHLPILRSRRLQRRKFRPHVDKYAADEEAFFRDFAAAFGKLLALGVPEPASAAAAK